MNLTDPNPPTAERTLRLIELLMEAPDGLSAQDLQLQLDLSRSSLFVLLRSLKTLGYIDQTEKRGRYKPGPRLEVWRSARGPLARDLITAFYQEAGSQPWEDTLLLLLPSESGPRPTAQVEGRRQVRCAFELGQPAPELLAAAQVLQSDPPAGVRQYGFALHEREEAVDLALPICRDGVHPEAALLLSAPRFRTPASHVLAQWLPDLRAMAARLSYQIGAPAYNPYRIDEERRLEPTRALTSAEVDGFLQGPWAARLACVRPDGSPHVIPVWQEWDGRGFTVIAWHGSQWADYVLQNPNISLTVDEPWAPLRRVVVRGEAAAVAPETPQLDLDGLLRRLTRRYLGQPSAAARQQVMVAFHIVPTSLRGWQGLSSALPQSEVR